MQLWQIFILWFMARFKISFGVTIHIYVQSQIIFKIGIILGFVEENLRNCRGTLYKTQNNEGWNILINMSLDLADNIGIIYPPEVKFVKNLNSLPRFANLSPINIQSLFIIHTFPNFLLYPHKFCEQSFRVSSSYFPSLHK